MHKALLVALLLLPLLACSEDDPVLPMGQVQLDAGDNLDAMGSNDGQDDSSNEGDGGALVDVLPDLTDGDLPPDAELDEGAFIDTPPDVDASCSCTDVSPCCDGCNMIDLGTFCDDGLDCTEGETCQDDGTCGGGESPCLELLDEPQCQTATCDELAGCSVEDVREGLRCDDGIEATSDERCSAGVCRSMELVCDGRPVNACGGCAELEGERGEQCDACGFSQWECAGTDAVTCPAAALPCECFPVGAETSCFELGLEHQAGVGACVEGMRTCEVTTEGGFVWGQECVGDVGPVVETCANQDEDSDCDGIMDNVREVGTSCESPEPGRCRTGRFICADDALVCEPVLSPIDEACNGVDDNCNGIVDEAGGFGAPRSVCSDGCVEHDDCAANRYCIGYTCRSASPLVVSGGAGDAERSVAQHLADCFLGTPDDQSVVCGVVDARTLPMSVDADDVIQWVCDDATESDFVGGNRDLEGAKAVVGCGIFNDVDLVWDLAIEPGTFAARCMWTIPAQSFLDEKNIVIDDCTGFPF